MRIIFVRHGHPDYKNDCLTELGHKQAEAVAKRLEDEKIDAIFSSSCGRARETAEHIAKARGMDVECLDFMREISWGPINDEELYKNGHPWRTVEKITNDAHSLLSANWGKEDYFNKNVGVENSEKVIKAFDAWLAELGYVREGEYYRVGEPKYGTIVLASHGGSSSAVLAHLFNLPLPFVFYAIRPDFTAVTVVNFKDEIGPLLGPMFEIANDARHIKNIGTENVYGF